LLIDLPAALLNDSDNVMLRKNTSSNLISLEKNENENEKKIITKNEKNISSTSLSDYNLIWQKEMEKGYDNLIESIIPLLGDMEGIQRLKR
jgi:hypothetical protein